MYFSGQQRLKGDVRLIYFLLLTVDKDISPLEIITIECGEIL
jgi:hypothetical protein